MQLQSDFERLLPELQELSKAEAAKRARAEESNGAGFAHAKDYENISKAE